MTLTKKILNKTSLLIGDNVLIYTVLLITSVMYYYRSSLTLLWFLISLVLVKLIFMIFGFMEKHKLLGTLIYMALFTGGMYLIGMAIKTGRKKYPISFILWFITTQDALEYSKWYTIAVFIFCVGFFASVVYYFTKIRYRMSMSFLVFMIPFVIYGKESRQMPAVLIILLSVLFIVNAIIFNNIRNGDDSEKVGRKNIFQSILVYVMSFGIIASLFPKPNIKEDRTYLESLINMDAFTDMLISRLNVFNTESSSGKFNSLTTNDRILYYANSDEPLRLKTQVFTDYDFSNDIWNSDYDNYNFKPYIFAKDPSEIIKLIVLCSELDNDFLKKYNINNTFKDIPKAEEKELYLYSLNYNSILLPVPSWLIDADLNQHIYGEFSDFGTLRGEDNASIPINAGYRLKYYSDSFLYNSGVYEIISNLTFDNAFEMYSDMYNILKDNGKSTEALTMSIAINDVYNAKHNLDYNDNQKIYDLAMEITDGITSDYEKALAIEKYFLLNDFTYDLTYRKGSNENAETFLFETKRGVCYEYATAMVLLSRACGIPARYAEGFNMNQTYADENISSERRQNIPNYVIKVKDAHGFPELYISGIGWTSFEPTLSNNIIDYKKVDVSKGIYTSGIILAVLLVFGLIIFRFYPEIYNCFFTIKIKSSKTTPEMATMLIFVRVREIFKYGKDVTAEELYQNLLLSNQADISLLKNLFEKSSYGKIKLSENDKKKVIELYSDLYDKFKKSRKERKKK